ncbi:hypothetical protein IWZ01DRAFT_129022 [Phyllosticta capitalensis]
MQTDVLPLLSSFPWLPVVHPPQSSTPHHTHSRLVQYHRRHRYLFHFCLGSRDMLMPIPPPLTPNLMARSCLSATMEACTTSSSADPISSSGPPDITSVLAQSRLKFIHVSHLLVHPYPGSSAASPGCRLVPLLPSHHRSSPRPWATKRKLEQEACDHRDDPRTIPSTPCFLSGTDSCRSHAPRQSRTRSYERSSYGFRSSSYFSQAAACEPAASAAVEVLYFRRTKQTPSSNASHQSQGCSLLRLPSQVSPLPWRRDRFLALRSRWSLACGC